MTTRTSSGVQDFLLCDLVCLGCVLPFRLMLAIGLTQSGWDQYQVPPVEWQFGLLIVSCEIVVAVASFRLAHRALRGRPITSSQGWTAIIAAGVALTVRCMASPAFDSISGGWGDWGIALIPFRAIWLSAYSVVVVRQIHLWQESAVAHS